MISIPPIFRWSWLLGVALLAPVALPAGGGELKSPEIRRRELFDPLVVNNTCSLRVSPILVAPELCNLDIGTPIRILRIWQSADGTDWLYVQIASIDTSGLPSVAKRGWINV